MTSKSQPIKRKLACRSCRQRKKRCDALQPSCSLCTKFNIRCEYSNSAPLRQIYSPEAVSAYSGDSAMPINEAGQMDWPLFDPDQNSQTVHTGYLLDTPIAALDTERAPGTTNSFPDLTSDTIMPDIPLPASLPADSVLISLVELFLLHSYDSFPCFHKTRLLQQVQSGRLKNEAPLLLFTICAIGAKYHPDPAIKALQKDWYDQAKFLYEMTERDPQPGLRTLQAAVCLIAYSGVLADFSGGWLFCGKAWRQACALNLNRLDSDRPPTFIHHYTPESLVEKEEYRRTLWLLFIFDRANIWPTGWAPAIDERQVKINIPVDEVSFQSMSPKTDEEDKSTPFSRDLNVMISTVQSGDTPNMFKYLIIAHNLLGRIVEHVFSLDDTLDAQDRAADSDRLEEYLVKLRLSMPPTATSILSAPPDIRKHVVWLNMVLNTTAILLHYKQPSQTTIPQPDSPNNPFKHVVIAAQNTIQLIKDSSLISVDILIFPHVAPLYYLSATVLAIEGRTRNYPSFQADMDLFCLVFERFKEHYPVVAVKYKAALEYDLTCSPENVAQHREAGYHGLLADCSKWNRLWQGFLQQAGSELALFNTSKY